MQVSPGPCMPLPWVQWMASWSKSFNVLVNTWSPYVHSCRVSCVQLLLSPRISLFRQPSSDWTQLCVDELYTSISGRSESKWTSRLLVAIALFQSLVSPLLPVGIASTPAIVQHSCWLPLEFFDMHVDFQWLSLFMTWFKRGSFSSFSGLPFSTLFTVCFPFLPRTWGACPFEFTPTYSLVMPPQLWQVVSFCQ